MSTWQPTPDDIVRGLEESSAAVLRAAADLAGGDWDRGRYESGWNARQILAHIASMEWTYPRIIDLARQVRDGRGEGHATMRGGNDDYNARQVGKRQDVPVSALIEEFRRNRAATIAAVRAADAGLWSIPVRSAGGVEGPLAFAFWQVTVEHVRGHARDLAGPSHTSS